MIEIDEDKCIGCGACAANCVAHNIEMIAYDNAEQGGDRQTSTIGDNVRKAKVLHECFLCGQCVAICPEAAPRNPYYQEELVAYNPKTFDLPTQM